MFGPDFIIDTIQSTKRVVTNKVITDEVLNKAANNYIDAQTVFAKMLVNNTLEIVKYSLDTACSKLYPKKEQASQAPYKVEKEAN